MYCMRLEIPSEVSCSSEAKSMQSEKDCIFLLVTLTVNKSALLGGFLFVFLHMQGGGGLEGQEEMQARWPQGGV